MDGDVGAWCSCEQAIEVRGARKIGCRVCTEQVESVAADAEIVEGELVGGDRNARKLPQRFCRDLVELGGRGQHLDIAQ